MHRPIQVKKQGLESIHIPDHEVITRRSQFRMKKDLADKKKEKKLKKEAEKAEKMKAKEEKKAAKAEASKKKKESKKASKTTGEESKIKSKKTGRSAAEKEKGWKKSTCDGKKKVKSTKKTMPPEEKDAAKKSEPEMVDPTLHEPVSMEDDVNIHPDELPHTPFKESTVPLDGKETFPVKSPKMKRIKKLAGKKDANKKQNRAKKAKAVKEQVEEDKTSKKGKKESDLLEKKTAKRQKKTGEHMPEKKKSKGKTITEKTDNAEGKENKPASKRQPRKAREDETKEKRVRRGVQPQEDIQVKPVVRDLVLGVLRECKSSHCTHPSFEQPNPGNGIYVMPYWSRNHAGVLIPRHFVKNPRKSSSSANPKSKSRKDRGSQVAYFGNDTPCAYTNILLAGAYVSCF